MKSKGISAALLEKILLFVIVLILGVTIAIYSFLSGFVKTQANIASESVAKADASQEDIDDLNKSYKWLQENPSIVEKTNKIVAEAGQYKYQDQVILDLESYAKQVGLTVTSYKFSETAAAPTTSPSTGSSAPVTTPPAAAAPAAGGATTGGAGAAAGTEKTPNGLNVATIDIALNSGVSYRKLLLFMKKIEQNVTRIQINAISISRAGDDDESTGGNVKDPVSVATFTISVFLNKET